MYTRKGGGLFIILEKRRLRGDKIYNLWAVRWNFGEHQPAVSNLLDRAEESEFHQMASEDGVFLNTGRLCDLLV